MPRWIGLTALLTASDPNGKPTTTRSGRLPAGYPPPPPGYSYPPPQYVAPPLPPGYHQHDGAYVRLQLGLGYLRLKASNGGDDVEAKGDKRFRTLKAWTQQMQTLFPNVTQLTVVNEVLLEDRTERQGMKLLLPEILCQSGHGG